MIADATRRSVRLIQLRQDAIDIHPRPTDDALYRAAKARHRSERALHARWLRDERRRLRESANADD